MNVRSILPALTIPWLVAAAGCASDPPAGQATGAARPESVQREYRTGSRFPVKEPATDLAPQERAQQVEDARASAQRSSIGAPPRGTG